MDTLKELRQSALPALPRDLKHKIGVIGAGFIVRDCHLAAYSKLGLNPYAITSLVRAESEAVAQRYNIPKVYDNVDALMADEDVEVLDIAVPPHEQLKIVEKACKHKHIKAILCQKPSALNYADALEIARIGKESGVLIGVNSNMRYDQSMRALKFCLNNGLLGTPILMSFEQRAIPHWQKFAEDYERRTFINFSIHELDIFRHMFGDPEYITALCRQDPRFDFEHTDGIVQYTYSYKDGLMATSLDDTFAYPGEPCKRDCYINWRVAGLEGLAKGTIGWPKFPELCPSTIVLDSKKFPGLLIEPVFDTCWFPDAFGGTMASLLVALENNAEPGISASDHAITIACAEACYLSIKEKRSVALEEIVK